MNNTQDGVKEKSEPKKSVTGWLDRLGWLAAASEVVLDILLSFGHVSAYSFLYQAASMINCSIMLALCLRQKTWQAASLNVFWIVVSVLSIVKQAITIHP